MQKGVTGNHQDTLYGSIIEMYGAKMQLQLNTRSIALNLQLQLGINLSDD